MFALDVVFTTCLASSAYVSWFSLLGFAWDRRRRALVLGS